MSDTEQPAPLLWHQGQAYSQESAAAELAKFDADEARVKAALGGDVAQQVARRDLWLLSRGIDPAAVPVMPRDAAGVEAQARSREEQLEEARLGTWRKHIRMDEMARAQVKRGLATQEEVDNAKDEIRDMIDDPEFRTALLRGDRHAKKLWHAANLTASMRVAPKDYDWAADTLDKFK
jgi:hypothetical protein